MREGIKIEVIIRDENYRKLDSFRCDIGSFHKIIGLLKKKYGLTFKQKKEIDWLGKFPT